MDYEIVELEEMNVYGLKIKTSNLDSDMGKKMGDLWKQLFESPDAQSPDSSIGLYYEYEGDFLKPYSYLTGWELTQEKQTPGDMYVKAVIQSGRYAKFTIKESNIEKIKEFWSELWKMDLTRKYVTDFEMYQLTDNGPEMQVYIGF